MSNFVLKDLLDEFHNKLFCAAKATMETGAVPCSLCGAASVWEDIEMVEYFCNPCLERQVEEGGEFAYQALQQPHQSSWLEEGVKGNNGPNPEENEDNHSE